ncbi:MAG: hypothetical protein FVQ85_06465 [Planctomycetes bacterium]|nr:hypothetical protein [Planctomycetota bacterium]
MNNELPTTSYESRLSSLICQPIMTYELRTTNYQLNTSDERSIFMQNKANFRKSQMNVNKVLTKDYEKRTLGGRGKNEPKTNPIKANTNPIKPNFEGKKIPGQTEPVKNIRTCCGTKRGNGCFNSACIFAFFSGRLFSFQIHYCCSAVCVINATDEN